MSKDKKNIKKTSATLEELAERPYAVQMIQTQILYDMAAMLEDLTETLANFYSEYKSTIPQGYLKEIRLTIIHEITSLTPILTPEYKLPWISFDLFNDGPNPVFIFVNEKILSVTTEVPSLGAGESLQVNMKKPLIKRIYLLCASGHQANVRIFAKY